MTTENAYLHDARISIAASVGGRVQQVMISDKQVVKANDPLFSVDNVPYRLGTRRVVDQRRTHWDLTAETSLFDGQGATAHRER